MGRRFERGYTRHLLFVQSTAGYVERHPIVPPNSHGYRSGTLQHWRLTSAIKRWTNNKDPEGHIHTAYFALADPDQAPAQEIGHNFRHAPPYFCPFPRTAPPPAP